MWNRLKKRRGDGVVGGCGLNGGWKMGTTRWAMAEKKTAACASANRVTCKGALKTADAT